MSRRFQAPGTAGKGQNVVRVSCRVGPGQGTGTSSMEEPESDCRVFKESDLFGQVILVGSRGACDPRKSHSQAGLIQDEGFGDLNRSWCGRDRSCVGLWPEGSERLPQEAGWADLPPPPLLHRQTSWCVSTASLLPLEAPGSTATSSKGGMCVPSEGPQLQGQPLVHLRRHVSPLRNQGEENWSLKLEPMSCLGMWGQERLAPLSTPQVVAPRVKLSKV